MSAWHDRVGDLTLFEGPTGGAFDSQNWQHSGEFDQNFSKKSNAPGFSRGAGGMGSFRMDRYITLNFLQTSFYNQAFLYYSNKLKY